MVNQKFVAEAIPEGKIMKYHFPGPLINIYKAGGVLITIPGVNAIAAIMGITLHTDTTIYFAHGNIQNNEGTIRPNQFNMQIFTVAAELTDNTALGAITFTVYFVEGHSGVPA